MPHIAVTGDLPGIRGLMRTRPDTADPLNSLAETLLRGAFDSPLGAGERELIAAYVSSLNGTRFCTGTHAAAAAEQLDGGAELVGAVLDDPATAPLTPLLRSLLRIAAEVQRHPQPVSSAAVQAARAAGAGDAEIHDTVLIAAAFCMYNRYVDGLDTAQPTQASYYAEAGRRISRHGYHGAV